MLTARGSLWLVPLAITLASLMRVGAEKPAEYQELSYLDQSCGAGAPLDAQFSGKLRSKTHHKKSNQRNGGSHKEVVAALSLSEVPSMVRISHSQNVTCAGVIISDFDILTAQECVFDCQSMASRNFSVRLGNGKQLGATNQDIALAASSTGNGSLSTGIERVIRAGCDGELGAGLALIRSKERLTGGSQYPEKAGGMAFAACLNRKRLRGSMSILAQWERHSQANSSRLETTRIKRSKLKRCFGSSLPEKWSPQRKEYLCFEVGPMHGGVMLGSGVFSIADDKWTLVALKTRDEDASGGRALFARVDKLLWWILSAMRAGVSSEIKLDRPTTESTLS